MRQMTFAMFVLVLGVSACGSDSNERVLGQWVNPRGAKVEFNADHVANLRQEGLLEAEPWNWRFADTAYVVYKDTALDGKASFRTEMVFTLRDTTLTLTAFIRSTEGKVTRVDGEKFAEMSRWSPADLVFTRVPVNKGRE